MRKFDVHRIGIAQGDVVLFSAFEDDGEMWTGDGPRVHREPVVFDEAFSSVPNVSVTLSMFDMSNDTFMRADVKAEEITSDGFDIVFRTWGDTKVARVRVAWQAIGSVQDEEVWDL